MTFLGTGTSQGVPVIGCNCFVCKSSNPKDKRLRSSILIDIDNSVIVIDTGPDFRQQMLRENVQKLDAIIFTHAHKDHTGGMDDIRAFNYLQQGPIDVYAESAVHRSLKREYKYIFDKMKYPGVPEVTMHKICEQVFYIHKIPVTPIRLMHYKLPILGFRIGNFAYLMDTNFIPQREKYKLQNLEVLAITGLRKEKHLSHYSINEGLEVIKELKPVNAYFSHIGHQLGTHDAVTNELPANVHLSYDGLVLKL